MRKLGLGVLLCVVMLTALLTGVGQAAHIYYTGILTSLSDEQLVLDNKNYNLAPKVKVLMRVVGSNGAVQEKAGRLSDLNPGNKVSIKVLNGQVTEVEKVVSR